jgi:hypothetical protein
MEQDFVDIMMIVAYALLGLAVLAVIILPIINAIGNPKSLVSGAIGLVFILVVFGIGYSIAGAEVTATFSKFGIDAGLSKYVGGIISTTYILVVIAIVGIAFTEISKIFS